MTPAAHELLLRLYDTPIEMLSLSEQTIRVLKWHGKTTIADCVRHYVSEAHWPPNMAQSKGLMLLMHGELAFQMKEYGYWPHVLDAEMWRALRNTPAEPLRMIVLWQGREQDLFEVPLDVLGLSHEALTTLEVSERIHNKLETIGDWLYEHGFQYTREDFFAEDLAPPEEDYFLLLHELVLKMKEQDCWPFISNHFEFVLDDIEL